jgi:hypothetical protein
MFDAIVLVLATSTAQTRKVPYDAGTSSDLFSKLLEIDYQPALKVTK